MKKKTKGSFSLVSDKMTSSTPRFVSGKLSETHTHFLWYTHKCAMCGREKNLRIQLRLERRIRSQKN